MEISAAQTISFFIFAFHPFFCLFVQHKNTTKKHKTKHHKHMQPELVYITKSSNQITIALEVIDPPSSFSACYFY